MANFGLTDLVVLDPYEPIWQETRSAPGAEKVVLEARLAADWEQAVKDCRIVLGTSSFHQRPVEQTTVELPNFGRYLSSYSSSAPLALVFGSERSGLSNEELARCQAILHIPTQRNVPSMNLGQAVAVVLYELRRSGWGPKAQATLSIPEEYARLPAKRNGKRR
jgi:TrmH family RNA methyltransferase